MSNNLFLNPINLWRESINDESEEYHDALDMEGETNGK